MALKYTGGGVGGFLPGIPARDLNDDEVKRHGGEVALIATGLYRKSESAAPAKGDSDKQAIKAIVKNLGEGKE